MLSRAICAFARRKLARMSSNSNPLVSLELLDFFDARTAPGIRVTPKAALTVPPFYRVVSMLARDVAKVPLKLYRVADDGSRQLVRNHPVAQLLRLKPNPEMTAYALKNSLVWNAVLHGNGYVYVRRNRAGTPIELWPIEAPNVVLQRDDDGTLYYRVTLPRSSGLDPYTSPPHPMTDGANVMDVAADDMIHVRIVTADGLAGVPLWKVAREDLATWIAIRRFSGALFRNYARPSMALVYPRQLNDNQRRAIREAFERMYTAENAHRVAVLDGGVDIKTFQINSREAEMTATILATMRNIAAFGNVPSSKVGDPSRTSYASLEAEMTSYLSESLDPILVAIEQEMMVKLLSEDEQENMYIEFERGALVRTDLESRYRAYTQGIQAGFLTRNEVRAKESLNPLPDGDRAFVPLNVTLTPPVDSGMTQRPQQPSAQQNNGDTSDDTADAVSDAQESDEEDATHS
jgi:HK97 family phage portal protein